MGRPRVRAIVLNYNGGAHVLTSIAALQATEWPADALDVVVVDNDSTDGSDLAVESQFPDVRVVRSGANLGFPANNLAMEDLAAVDYVALVNNDAFVEPGWLEPLVEVLERDPGLGAACPKILFAPRFTELVVESPVFSPGGADPRELGIRISGIEVDGEDVWRGSQFAEGVHGIEHGPDPESTFQWTDGRATIRIPRGETGTARLRIGGEPGTTVRLGCGDRWDEVVLGASPVWADVSLDGPAVDVVNNVGSVLIEGGWGADRGFLEVDVGQYDEPAGVFAWCGAGVLFPDRYLREVGLFDERFFMYYEDTDLSWRGRAQGWRYRYEPRSVFRHIHAATSVEGSAMFQHYVERNRLLMLTKNAPARLAVGAVVRFLLSTASYARRDVLRPLLGGHRPQLQLLRSRLRSFLAFARLLPSMLRDRRVLRRRQIVRDDELVRWVTARPGDLP